MLIPNPDTEVRWSHNTTGGEPVLGSRRSITFLDFLVEELAREHPDCRLLIIQSAYHKGLKASQGTHDYDACYDAKIEGMPWSDAEKWLRSKGAAAWHRVIAQGFTMEHIHFIILGYTTKVGEYIDGGVSLTGRKYTSSQVDDYYGHSLGLKGLHDSGDDPTWHPTDINATIFDFVTYWEKKHMSLADSITELTKQYGVSRIWIARVALYESTKRAKGVARARVVQARLLLKGLGDPHK